MAMRVSMMSTNFGRSNSGLQPQSRLAALSSNAIGQPSASAAEAENRGFSKFWLFSYNHLVILFTSIPTYWLSDVIHFVSDLEVGQDFLYLFSKFVWGEACRVDVVCATQQRLSRSFKDFQGGPQAVVYTAQEKKRNKEKNKARQ